jgi:putative iron-dependent peroxidase
MLDHMFIGDPPGNYDRILDFSTPITGTLFFVPTTDFLEDPPALPDAGDGVGADAPAQTGEDESLGIGGLRGSG